MLIDLRIIIFHQIASRGRISSYRHIGDIYTRFGIYLLAVGSILECVSKLWKYNWRRTKNITCYCFSFVWSGTLILRSYCFRKMAPPPPPPCGLCKSRCASSPATRKLFGIYSQPSFRHAAVRNDMKCYFIFSVGITALCHFAFFTQIVPCNMRLKSTSW